VMGLEVVQVLSPAPESGWILGVDTLDDVAPAAVPLAVNDVAQLGASPLFATYSFQVEITTPLTAEEEIIATQIVNLVKPAHTHFLGFFIPAAAGPVDHWELGLSNLHASGEPIQGDEIDLHD